MRLALAVSVSLLACGPPHPATPTPPSPPASAELSPALAPLAWWVGDWRGADGSEHWVAAAGALYGVALSAAGGFEVMIVDDAEGAGPADGVLRLFAMPGGATSTEFRGTSVGERHAVFANPAHDDPKTIEYRRTAAGLRAQLGGATTLTFDFVPTPHVPAPELEAADRAFAAEVRVRKAAGWAAWFAPDGWMLRKGEKITGAAIAASMEALLSSGELAWAPIASGKAGAIGYTVGTARFTGSAADDHWRSSYVTIWKQQPDGGWKVLFDIGRDVNEP